MTTQTESSQNSLNPNNEILIEEDLEKLFAFQDKHLTKDRRQILVKELMSSSIPIGAILLGIRKLMNEDLQSIKMGTILAAARSHVDRSEESKGCKECSRGIVLMNDEEGRFFSMSCNCSSGIGINMTQGLVRWRGMDAQMVNGRNLFKVYVS
jgi:hypothetical protein